MNLKEIFELMDKFEKTELKEIKVSQGDTSVTLKKGHDEPVFQAPVYHYGPPAGHPAPAHAAPAASAAAAAAPTAKEGVEVLTSPIVGTFYRSSAPDQPAFCDVGSKVEAGATLCIIEAMKVMNKFEAEHKFEIVSILVSNGQMVEFGTPLYEVKRI